MEPVAPRQTFPHLKVGAETIRRGHPMTTVAVLLGLFLLWILLQKVILPRLGIST